MTLTAPDADAVPAVETAGPRPGALRPRAAGKFLAVGADKLFVRGVTYGTFPAGPDGSGYPEAEGLHRDFEAMAASGINALRTYDVPPVRVLDAALRHGLWVMVGLPWEQHVDFLAERRTRDAIERRVREGARTVAGHPALLALAVGNEIPASIVRWLGRRRVERFLARLCAAVREEDPGALVTYVNYPTTEYLRLPFVDLVCFNVYLEARDRYESYVARLHSLAGDRPLVMAEIGLDSRRNGDAAQADSLAWQIQSAFTGGCAGAFVFAWTDEWARGDAAIEDWDFGLTDRDRRPKPALAAVGRAYADVPFPARSWPRVSVVVCSYNGARTIRDCLEGLARLDYPDLEVIVIDDGSTDATPAIASEYDVRVVSTQNRGLSAARNLGLELATGEIVAYTDDDARPDPHWLRYLAATMVDGGFAAAGGPNIAPPGDGPIADAVANAPGGPVHVLLTDRVAEHVPGCNMAFRREALLAIGGFDPVYRAAGDDVDACWRIQDAGGTIGFSPAAMVWHHRRNSVRTYWKQQQGYGKAEALLERKWPEKYNALGHLNWSGRLYGKGLTVALRARGGRLYGGTWGTAAYQSLYEPGFSWLSLPLMPEWYLVVGGLAALTLLGLAWGPLVFAAPLLALAVLAPVAQAALSARAAAFTSRPRGARERIRLRLLTFLLHLLQPLARLRGRIRHGLSPWRLRGGGRLAWPAPRERTGWSEVWTAPERRLERTEARLKSTGGAVLRGGPTDRWDLELRAGLLGSARLLAATEEHGAGRQLARYRVWPRPSRTGLALIAGSATLAVAALAGGSVPVASVLGALSLVLLARLVVDTALAVGGLIDAVPPAGVGEERGRG